MHAGFVGKRDLVILFTIHDSVRYDKYVKQCKERGCTVVCVTMTQDLTYRKLCDTYVVLPRISRDSKVSFLDDQPLFMIYIEILLAEIAKL
jgi:Transcriptional regulators